MRVCLGPGFPYSSAGKESACNAGDLGLIPGLASSPGEGKGCPLQYSGLENSMDCIVHGVAKSQTQLSDFHFTGPAFNRGMSRTQSNTEIPVPSWLFLVKGEISPQTGVSVAWAFHKWTELRHLDVSSASLNLRLHGKGSWRRPAIPDAMLAGLQRQG